MGRACRSGSAADVERALAGAGCSGREAGLLHAAAQRDDEELEAISALLLSRGADIDGKNECGEGALHAACGAGSLRAVEFLLSRGADVCSEDKWGRTPLHTACRRRSKPVVERLIRGGADVNSISRIEGSSPLFLACREDSPDVAVHLLENGADIDFQLEGDYLIHVASRMGGSARIMKHLLERKNNVNMANGSGEFPLFLAMASRAPLDAVMTLISFGADVRDRGLLYFATLWYKDTHLIEEMVARGALDTELTTRERFSSTMISAAVSRGFERFRGNSIWCPCCLENDLRKSFLMECGHVMCIACHNMQWFENQLQDCRCPTCRERTRYPRKLLLGAHASAEFRQRQVRTADTLGRQLLRAGVDVHSIPQPCFGFHSRHREVHLATIERLTSL